MSPCVNTQLLKGKGTNYFGTEGQRQPLDRGILIMKSIGMLVLLQEGPLVTQGTLLPLPTQQEGWDCVHTFLESKRPTTVGHLEGYTQQVVPLLISLRPVPWWSSEAGPFHISLNPSSFETQDPLGHSLTQETSL